MSIFESIIAAQKKAIANKDKIIKDLTEKNEEYFDKLSKDDLGYSKELLIKLEAAELMQGELQDEIKRLRNDNIILREDTERSSIDREMLM